MVESTGERLKRLRLENGYKRQDELGHRIGASKQTISSWEKHNIIPDLDYCLKLADIYNVSIDYLLCHSDYRRPENADIGEKIGLSEKSVEVLKRFQSEDEDIYKENLKGLNFILESIYDEYSKYLVEETIEEKEHPELFSLYDEAIKENPDVTTIACYEYSGKVYDFTVINKQNPDNRIGKRINRLPETSILSDIYKIVREREYQNTNSYKRLVLKSSIEYTERELWYVLHLENIKKWINSKREGLSWQV